MSRCFPFPPPGYEKKARTDDVDVLKKEKQREKKHKKDKKDKEKREKEKNEKDRSDGKHREKKDKKEKNREKKKDKEKDTDKVKDKPGTSDGTRLSGKIENHVTEKLIHKDDRDKRDVSQVGGNQAEKFGQNSHLPENRNSVSVEVAKKTKDEARGIQVGGYQAEKLGQNSHLPAESRKSVSMEVARKTKDEARGSQVGGYQAEKLGQNSHLPAENRNSVSMEVARKTKDEARGGQVGGYQAEKVGQNSHLPAENRNFVSVEVARKTKDGARGIKNQLVEKITSSDRKKDEGMVRFVAKRTGILGEVKETSKDKRVDIRKPDVQEVRVAQQFSGSAMVQNRGGPVEVPGGMVQANVQGLSKPLESNVERKTDGKEKTKEKEGDDKRGEKRKDKDREKKSQGKDKDRDKEKKKEEKAKKKNVSKTAEPDEEKKKEDKGNEKNGSKHAEPDKSRETNNDVSVDSQYSKPSQPPKDVNKIADAEGDLKKRKDFKTNGVLHANETRPNKLLRPSSSSHPLTQNGRTVEPCQTSIPYVSDMHEGANSIKIDSKERKKNGFIEARPSSVSPAKPPSTAAQADPFAEASMRPPHPDSRFLSEVYMVPKMNELADDDQDWLFGCSDTKSKKPKVESSLDEETAQVWSEALRIESADVCALPYVIPY